VRVDNFKRFRHTEIELRAMTVLTGLNGTGKSTVIQGLLLARYATEFADHGVVPLNGPYGLSLGEANEVLHLDADIQEISIVLRAAAHAYPYRFGVPVERSLNLPILERPSIAPDVFSEHGRRFAYLNAERLGPRDQLQVNAEDVSWLGVGEQGQYTAQVLATEESTVVREPLRHPKTAQHGVGTLRTQVENWAEEIIRPVRVEAHWPPGISASIIRFSEPGWRGEPIRPANIGFGFSYALPIVVAGLLMPSGGMFIIENPEAHLHPAGQSRLGRFLARLAGSGTQVVIETHSDHVVNGVRLGIAVDQTLRHSDTIIHFFDDAEGAGQPTSVEVTPRGELTSWPTGFFDQLEHDLGRLARARRG
jgi:predicted ATPase